MLSLPAGFSCPFAKICKSCAARDTGKITDGKNCKFRCYAVAAENLFPKVRANRWRNWELLKEAKTTIGMANLLESSLIVMRNIELVRFGQSGDFFNQAYFDAWRLVAEQHPEWIFYGYTKALPYWAKRLNIIPSNMKLTASQGGTHDHLIRDLGLRSARVVFTEKEAADLGLEIDHDDTHCWKGDKDFAILLHGTQPAGSEAGKAWYQIKNHGPGGYYADYFHANAKKAKAAAKVKMVSVTAIKPLWKFKPNVNGMRKVSAHRWIKTY
jgi:hypothetical protein